MIWSGINLSSSTSLWIVPGSRHCCQSRALFADDSGNQLMVVCNVHGWWQRNDLCLFLANRGRQSLGWWCRGIIADNNRKKEMGKKEESKRNNVGKIDKINMSHTEVRIRKGVIIVCNAINVNVVEFIWVLNFVMWGYFVLQKLYRYWILLWLNMNKISKI